MVGSGRDSAFPIPATQKNLFAATKFRHIQKKWMDQSVIGVWHVYTVIVSIIGSENQRMIQVLFYNLQPRRYGRLPYYRNVVPFIQKSTSKQPCDRRTPNPPLTPMMNNNESNQQPTNHNNITTTTKQISFSPTNRCSCGLYGDSQSLARHKVPQRK